MEKIGIIIGLKKNKLKEHQKSYREANKSKKLDLVINVLIK